MMLDSDNIVQRAITGAIAIPDFVSFCAELSVLFRFTRIQSVNKKESG